jgi:hypothetical protein
MPKRELKSGKQVAEWIIDLSQCLEQPGTMILIGSAALLWHTHHRGIKAELPEGSMDVDPITDSDEIARRCYDCLIGSEFEKQHGWHVNLMPDSVLNELPAGWKQRAEIQRHGNLTLFVPQPADLLVPKLRRKEPRDLKHYEWAKAIGLIAGEIKIEPKANP